MLSIKLQGNPKLCSITPSTQGHHVDFSFSRFQFEEVGKECRENYDRLKLIDGNKIGDRMIDFCSNGPDPLNKTFSSQNNEITLWMFSDGSVGGKGNKASNTNAPSPRLSRNHYMQTSQTRLFKRFPFLT